VTNPQISYIVRMVLGQMPLGRASTWQPVAERMMELVVEAGDGDHLEIGVLHGATAIMTALTKISFQIKGDVICIDPLQGFYPPDPSHPDGVFSDSGELITNAVEPSTKTPVSPKIFRANVSFFGVGHRISLVQAFSDPWPDALVDYRFTSAYIDGNHYQDGPLKDWNNVHPRIVPGGLVWFDDCNDNCPGVQKACDVAVNTPGWTFIEHFMDQTFVMKKDGS